VFDIYILSFVSVHNGDEPPQDRPSGDWHLDLFRDAVLFYGERSKVRMSINEDIKTETKRHICGLFKVPSQRLCVGRPDMTSGLIVIRVTYPRILIRNQNFCA